MVSVVFFLVESVTYLFISIYFWFISNQWLYLQYVSVAIIAITVVVLNYMPESPKFLLSVGRYDEAKDVLTWMAKYNGLDGIPPELLKKINNLQVQQERLSQMMSINKNDESVSDHNLSIDL